MEVAWDRRKAAANLKKHKVSFEEASTVLADPMAITGLTQITRSARSAGSHSASRVAGGSSPSPIPKRTT
jgi:uncharacterized DUF497 family protein